MMVSTPMPKRVRAPAPGARFVVTAVQPVKGEMITSVRSSRLASTCADAAFFHSRPQVKRGQPARRRPRTQLRGRLRGDAENFCPRPGLRQPRGRAKPKREHASG
jgi:hypothetical protein